MDRVVHKRVGLTMFVLLVFSCLLPIAARAQEACIPPQCLPPSGSPVIVILNADANGNYPGGNEFFNVAVVDSNINGNITINSATLSTPFFNNTGTGLPTTLAVGYAYATDIPIPIPADFSQSNFTATLTVTGEYANGTGFAPWTRVGSANVYVFALPSSTASQTTSQSTAQSGTVSSTLFAAGVAIPSIIAVVLLILLVRARPATKQTGT